MARADLQLPFAMSGAPGGSTNLGLPFATGGAPSATGSIPGLNNLAVNTVARPNSYVGLNSFVSVVAHYVSVANNNAMDDPNSVRDARELGLSMLVFARDTFAIGENRPHRPMYGTAPNQKSNDHTCEFKELTQLNTYLLRNSAYYSSASQILAEWKMMGVIKTEGAPYSLGSQATPYGNAAQSRILNLVVGYRVATFNYWVNSPIIQTQRLFIIVKKNATGVWQLYPWTSPNKNVPGLEDLKFVDKDGDVAYGDFIYVGKSSDQNLAHISMNSKVGTTTTDFSSSLVKRGMLSTIEILLGV